MELKNAVPWGRSYEEYLSMFSLSEDDLKQYILDVSGGPSGFNAGVKDRGGHMTTIDPVYEFSKDEIDARIQEVYPQIESQLTKNKENYHWDFYPDPQTLCQTRMKAMSTFLEDYELGTRQNRYVKGALPDLPLENDCFDIALCSHFLFTYCYHFDVEFHIEALFEMLRVSSEVRVFPIVAIDSKPVPFFEEVLDRLHKSGFVTTLKEVSYEFQKGANQMLVITKG
jgi:hypothetical protein